MSASSKDGLLAVCGSMIGLSTITTSLRFYGRKIQAQHMGPDDYTALFGAITYIGAAALAIELAVIGSNGYAMLTPEESAKILKPTVQMSLAYDFLIMNTLACAKLSALFLYRRIFHRVGHKIFDALIWTTVAVIAAWYITFDFLSLYQCRTHFQAFWDGDFTKYCTLNDPWAQGLAISDFVLDLWVLLLPVPRVWTLQVNTAKRLSIIGVFLLAGVGLGASVARIAIFFLDTSPSGVTLYIGALEAGVTITVVNLPSIYYLCTSIIPEQMARSIGSIHSLHSISPQASHQASKEEPSEVAKSSKSGLRVATSTMGSDSFWRSRSLDPAHGLRPDVEDGDFKASAIRAEEGEHDASQSRQFPSNAIQVQSDFHVQRE